MTSEFIADECKRRANRGSLAEHPLTKARHDWQTARIAKHQCKTYKNLLHTIAITYPGFTNQTDRIGQGQSLARIHELNFIRHNSCLKKSLRLSCPKHRVLKPEAQAKDCAWFASLAIQAWIIRAKVSSPWLTQRPLVPHRCFARLQLPERCCASNSGPGRLSQP